MENYRIYYSSNKRIYNGVMNFINDSLHELYALNEKNEDIRILMPKYFNNILTQQLGGIINVKYNAEAEYVFGIKILPHYKNEIVVYTTNVLRDIKPLKMSL